MKIEQWKIDKIIPYENNPRINDGAVEKTAMSIREYGWQQPIVVDTDGIIIVGHTRLKAAQSMGLEECPVHVAENLTEAQVKAYRIADNKTGELAEWDMDLLNLEIKDLVDLDFDIELTGVDLDEFDPPVVQPTIEETDKTKEKIDLLPLKRFSINKTRTAYFFSIRRWSVNSKKEQIKHVQDMKQNLNNDFIDSVVSDFIEFFSVFNSLSDYIVTHAPAGNSVGKKFNLATEIAKRVSVKLGIEYRKLFSDFPKKTKEVGNYKNKQNTGFITPVPADSRILLIDDVATTGTTIETCVSLLCHCHVIPVVWVYSEAINNE